jgi:anti-sigma B factor antagonist
VNNFPTFRVRERCNIPNMLHAFDIEISQQPDGTSVLAVNGELDLASAALFRERVGEALGTGARDLVIDLTDVEFIDSSGLGALLWAQHRAQAVGGDLHAVHCCPPVERAFALAGLTQLLH